jgi:hypothetical protein
MIEHLTHGKRLPEEVLRQIVERTDRVPLFVEELTQTVVEGGERALARGRRPLCALWPIAPARYPHDLTGLAAVAARPAGRGTGDRADEHWMAAEIHRLAGNSMPRSRWHESKAQSCGNRAPQQALRVYRGAATRPALGHLEIEALGLIASHSASASAASFLPRLRYGLTSCGAINCDGPGCLDSFRGE